jgi:hypothetical protein
MRDGAGAAETLARFVAEVSYATALLGQTPAFCLT